MKKLFVIGGIIILVGVIAYFAVFYKKEGKGKEIYTFKAEKGDIVSSVSATGRIEPKIKVNISANVLGEIKELAVKDGSKVKKGDLLLQIDKERYLSEVHRLEAYLRMSRITVEREKVNLQNIENDLKRASALHAERIVSDDNLEKAQLQDDTQRIYLKSLDEQVAQAEADLLKAKDELGKTTIRSPMDGVVTQLNSEVGEQVLMGTTNIPGTVIMVVSDMSEVLAEIDVDETEIVSVKRDQKAEIVVDAIGEKHKYEGKIEDIGNSAVRKGEVNTFPVKIRIVDPDARLKPGMTARAQIETERRDDVVKIPIQAVIQRNIEKEKQKAKEKRSKLEGKKKEMKENQGKPGTKETADPGGGGNVGAQESETVKAEEKKTGTTNRAGMMKKEKEKARDAVYLMVKGKAVLTPVETGISDEFYVEVKNGVKEGDMVVTGPYRTLKNLKEGDRIKEKEEKGDEEGKEGSEVEVKIED